MAVAGIAWGIYSLRGRGSGDPVAATAGSFARAVPFALLVSLAMLQNLEITARGAWLADLSGGLAVRRRGSDCAKREDEDSVSFNLRILS
jgi:hypothetical protein